MNLFDTNVLLDIATADPVWLPWSEKQLRAAAARGPILINPIIYAEMAPAFASASDLDQWLDPAVFQRLPLPYQHPTIVSPLQAVRKLTARSVLQERIKTGEGASTFLNLSSDSIAQPWGPILLQAGILGFQRL